MANTVAFSDMPETALKSGLTVNMTVPEGVEYRRRSVPGLGYPIEVATFANWEIPDTPEAEEPTNSPPAWPRVDLLPSSGMLLWLLRGAVAFDFEIEPEEAAAFNPSQFVYLAPPGSVAANPNPEADGVTTTVLPLSGEDEQPSWWSTARMWGRRIPLTDPSGSRVDQPIYLQFYAFVGSGVNNVNQIDSLLESLQVNYG
jgi:hypothetical protein